MALLGPLASLLGIELDALKEKLLRNAMTYAVLALLVSVGLVFALVCVYLLLGLLVGPIWSAAILAAVFLLAAAIVVFATRAAEAARRRRILEQRRATEPATLATTAALAAIPMLFKNPLVRAALVPAGVMAAYFVLGRGRDGDA